MLVCRPCTRQAGMHRQTANRIDQLPCGLPNPQLTPLCATAGLVESASSTEQTSRARSNVGLRRVRRCLCSSQSGRCWARAVGHGPSGQPFSSPGSKPMLKDGKRSTSISVSMCAASLLFPYSIRTSAVPPARPKRLPDQADSWIGGRSDLYCDGISGNGPEPPVVTIPDPGFRHSLPG